MHCEAKQTDTLELGADKGLLQSQTRTMGSLCSKSPTTLLGKRFYKQNLGGGLQGCVTFSLIGWWEVAEWWSRKLNHQSSSSNHAGIHVLLLSLKLPSSTWVGTLVSISDCFVFPLRRNQDPAPSKHYFLTAFLFFFLQSLTPLINNYLHLLFGTRTWKDCCVLEGLTGFCSVSAWSLWSFVTVVHFILFCTYF